MRFSEWPLQVLPDSTALVAEAISEAVETSYEGIPRRVFRPEHLCCVALDTGRTKDFLRVQMFFEQGEVDREALAAMAKRFELGAKLGKAESLFNGTRRNES